MAKIIPVGFWCREDLVERGVFGGIIDLTTHELIEEIVGMGAYVPVKPGRLTTAGLQGVPQVISLGGLEYLCFGSRETIPPRLRRRKIYMHNPLNANVKASLIEMKKAGNELAKRLNQATGPVEVLVPLRGWSVYGAPGGALYDPEGNEALLTALKKRLKPSIPIRELDLSINDPSFADACVEALARINDDYLLPGRTLPLLLQSVPAGIGGGDRRKPEHSNPGNEYGTDYSYRDFSGRCRARDECFG
ncbi:MAG TPA: Tm-1-like ATP-binding domain-containing protein [Spirochaetales bacterium]|nr:Tm-1-like ATP-binding domain-containing protein [Spirochaetales bacterium]